MRKTLAIVATSGFILLAPAAVASAEPLAAATTSTLVATEEVDAPEVTANDEGDKTGLWGLLGLLGLAGLVKRKVKDDDHNHR